MPFYSKFFGIQQEVKLLHHHQSTKNKGYTNKQLKLFPEEYIHFEMPTSDLYLYADRAQIEQVLINLLKMPAKRASGERIKTLR